MRETKKGRPSYDLDEAKRLVASGNYSVTKQVRRFIVNHWEDDANRVIEEIFKAVTPAGFRKSMRLDNYPDVIADVYYVDYEDETWYLKFYRNEDGGTGIMVLSCWLDGYPH